MLQVDSLALPPIRPGSTPPLPARTTPVGGARAAAQRAFFEAALTKAGAPAAAQAPAPVQATSAVQPSVTRLRGETVMPQPEPEAPTRYPRPGSLVDIKV